MPPERQGQMFCISFDSERDIYIAKIPGGAAIEVDRDFNTLFGTCKNQGMIYYGISEESDDFPPRYYGKQSS